MKQPEAMQLHVAVCKEDVEQEAALKIQLAEVNKKVDSIQEKHYALDEMN